MIRGLLAALLLFVLLLGAGCSLNSPITMSLNCTPGAPLGTTQLYLRGTMNNWTASDDYALQYSCDAYYVNVKLNGRHEFKLGDAAWSDAATFGEGNGNFALVFAGEQTLRIAFSAGRPLISLGSKTFEDPNARPVTDPVALGLRFDSRSAAHKQPFGAQVAGTSFEFAVQAFPGVERLMLVVEKRRLEGNQEVLEYSEVARVPMTKVRLQTAAVPPSPAEGGGLLGKAESTRGDNERWTASHRFSDVSIYGYWFEAQIGGKRYALQNNRDAVHWTRERGSGGGAGVAELPTPLSMIRRFRQTIYSADFKVPDWAADVVYYYIFPDRYRNGDRSNDPKPGRDRYQNHTVELHANWLDKPWKPGSGDGSDAVYNNDFFGGDLAGIIEKLDDIRDLGANAIYMTPVFRAASNHKYDTADYTTIDPAFGSNADFERLTREAAKRGIRIIPDTSLNHVGSDSIYFDRFGNFKTRGAFEGSRIHNDSPYASWFSFDARQREPEAQFKGWVGVKDLPEIDKASPAFRDFAYRAPDSVMKLWLDRGAAGWRMDVAPWVPDDFWREWRTAIRAYRADALTVAETWFDSSKYLLGDMFDSTMNYIFRNAVQDYAAGGKAGELVAQLEHLREAYPAQAHTALMNLLSSHDQARALHHFGWHDEAKDSAEVVQLAKQRLRLAAFIQMTHPGAPTVYYGDEVGVTGGDDPYNRATYPWPDQGGKPDLALRGDFKRLIGMRHAHPVLRRGSMQAPLHVDGHSVVMLRRLDATWALVGWNNAATARRVSITLPPGAPAAWRDALLGSSADAAAQRLVLDLPARFGTVLVSR